MAALRRLLHPEQPVLETPSGHALPEHVFCCVPLRGGLRQAAIAVTFAPGALAPPPRARAQ